MGVEIERKFLTVSDGWKSEAKSRSKITQGYFRSPDATVRVRLVDDKALLTIKGPTTGISRAEWEYEIPPVDADELIAQFCTGRTLSKTRHYIEHGELTWEVDEFHGVFDGLIVAEVELDSADFEFVSPDWVGAEVSHDTRYFNQALVMSQKIPAIEP